MPAGVLEAPLVRYTARTAKSKEITESYRPVLADGRGGIAAMAASLVLAGCGVGVWASAHEKRALRLIGGLLIGIGVVGLATPPMYLRGTGNVSGDIPHIVLTGVIVAFILSAVAFGASLYGGRWRLYSFATLLILLVSGAWTGLEATRLAAQQPTPWLGVAERINIGAYLLWVLVLAITLLRWKTPSTNARTAESRLTTGDSPAVESIHGAAGKSPVHPPWRHRPAASAPGLPSLPADRTGE